MTTVARQSPVPGSQSFRWRRAAVPLVVATVGLGLNLRAWILLGPHLHDRFDVSPGEFVVLTGLPLLVAAVVRVPVGVLTDRYGARVMFPVISVAAAASVIGLGLADTLPAAVIAGSVAGVAGTAFVVGGWLVARTFPYGRRGVALGIFSLGPAVAVAISAGSRQFGVGSQRTAFVLGTLLLGFAGLAALLLRDDIATRRFDAPVRRSVEMIRLAATTSLSLLYAMALGGVVATAVYLPVYLVTVFDVTWFHALVVTGVVVTIASTARLAGGWWADRRPTARLLTVCYGIAAGMCLVLTLQPRLWWLTVPMIAAMAVCEGLASGALLAFIGKAAPPQRVGAVLGATGAAAALGALLPPMLLVGVDQLSDSYAAAWVLLAAALAAAALYVRANGLRTVMGLPMPFEPEPSPTALTVVLVGEADTKYGAAAVVARLAELAVRDELVVVYGCDVPVGPRLSSNVLVAGLRDRLPRHNVVGVRVTRGPEALGRLAALLGEFVEAGTVAVANTPSLDRRDVAAELSSYLQADRVLIASYSLAAGAHLQEVWNRTWPTPTTTS